MAEYAEAMIGSRFDWMPTYEGWLTALFLWREARGSNDDVIAGILWTIKNRAANKERYPNTLVEVILQSGAYPHFSGEALFPNPAILTGWQAFRDCLRVLNEESEDPTNGATHFEDTSPEEVPRWATPENLTAKIGAFRFYRL